MSRQHSAGKGDSPRKVDQQKYRENYEKIFGKKKNQSTKKKKKAWPFFFFVYNNYKGVNTWLREF